MHLICYFRDFEIYVKNNRIIMFNFRACMFVRACEDETEKEELRPFDLQGTERMFVVKSAG